MRSNLHDLLLPGARGYGLELTEDKEGLWLCRPDDGSKILVVKSEESKRPWREIRETVAPKYDAAREAMGKPIV